MVPRTLHNIQGHLYQYLGFLKLYMNKQPTLYSLLDLESYAAYLSFQRAKGNAFQTVSQQIASARKTLVYLQLHHMPDELIFSKMVAAREWLSRVNKQLAHIMTKPNMKQDISDLPHAHEIVHLLEKLRQKALQSLPPLGQLPSIETARLMHDACLACCMFGYLPPIRLVCLRTLQMPESGLCLVPGCLKIGCRGNRLCWQNGHLCLHLNHYKVERK